MIKYSTFLACALLAASVSLAHAATVESVDACYAARAAPQDTSFVVGDIEYITINNVGEYVVPIVQSDPRASFAVLLNEPNQTAWPGSRLVASPRFHLRL